MDSRVSAELSEHEPGPATLAWLTSLGVYHPSTAARDLLPLASLPPGDPALADLLGQIDSVLRLCPDPSMAVRNFGRFLAATLDLAQLAARLRSAPRLTEALLRLFSTSQYFSDLIIGDPGVLDWLAAIPARESREALRERLETELRNARDELDERLILRRFRHRQMLRIGYNDVVRGLPLELVTQDISHLAEVCVDAAYRLARARVAARFGDARSADGQPTRFVVLALGKLGGEELNYSSDIDLIFVYESDQVHRSPSSPVPSEFFSRVGGELIRILSDHTPIGQAYRVDMRLRPEGSHGPLVKSLASTIGYYETSGRTWERQALIKCRPVAGDLELGQRFIEAITPFVYRRFLSSAEIAEIRALKRQIEARVRSRGDDLTEVKTGRGGIRDVEFTVQFLQLMHGGAHPSVRHVNTLATLERLEQAGCLASDERAALDDTYRFLRKAEHRLQILHDRQTHRLPDDPAEIRALAIRMGYTRSTAWEDPNGPAERFLTDYRTKTERNRRILNHLLHDAFTDQPGATPDPLVDLVLDPDPSPELLRTALGRYPFRNLQSAYQCLMALAREEWPFLSQPRCRHFLAAIAPALIRATAATPDPDRTLANLEKVSASLGAKAALWELFQLNPPSLTLYVELCASSPLLSDLLISNPGMIDDLIDSLVVDRPQSESEIRADLIELCRGAEDLQPIVLSFRNREWLRIGTRDILNREPIREVTRELADVAGAITQQVARDQWRFVASKLGGTRSLRSDPGLRWAILALGKLGGRELSYLGDLDLIFLYDADPPAHHPKSESAAAIAELFTHWAQRIIRFLEASDRGGPIYRVDTRLRPHGTSGPLAVSLASFCAYYQNTARAWERLALVRSRVLAARGAFGRQVEDAIAAILNEPIDPRDLAAQTLAMRRKLAGSRPAHDLKRGTGGLVDIEFLIQYLQLLHRPASVQPNAWDALDILHHHGILPAEHHAALTDAYTFLRLVESRSRLIRNQADARSPLDDHAAAAVARHLFPKAATAAEALDALRSEAYRHTSAVQSLFEAYVATPAIREGAT
ncbi:MAG: glutamate-ammonia-ligase adenylyltransferase [Isosphaeraceae bacterium]|jgi:glutamate-ammonia-ligase adenylyltransferase|nr:MAG: glutamate-ammonia-ligase adenylyltransferase [Isosphaeraceae bacterium]